VRDGRDVTEAWQRFPAGPVTALGIGRKWRGDVTAWRKYCDQNKSEGMLEVRYEDLVTKPRKVLSRIFEFLDEPIVNTTDVYADTELSELYSDHAWHSSSRKSISDEKVGIYRKRLSKREVEIIEYVAGDALLTCGYALEHQNPKAPNLREKIFSFVADRIVRWCRKLLRPKFVVWELQSRIRKLLRFLQWTLRQRLDY